MPNYKHRYLPQTGVVLQSLWLLAGCSPSLGPTQIEPRDPNYPVPNRTPTEIVQVIAKIPPSFTVNFTVAYKASDTSGSNCHRTVGFAATAPITLSLPLRFARDGDTFSGRFALDAFQPGECGWGFVGFGYTIDGALPTAQALVNIGEGHSSAYQLDVWCVNATVISKEFPRVCTNLVQLNRQFKDLTPDWLLAETPPDRNGLHTPTRIGSATQSINVQFHDVDALRTDRR